VYRKDDVHKEKPLARKRSRKPLNIKDQKEQLATDEERFLANIHQHPNFVGMNIMLLTL
jgi:serine/threonine protein kinase